MRIFNILPQTLKSLVCVCSALRFCVVSMSFTWCVCALCPLYFPVLGHWQIWVKLDKVTGTIVEDLSGSWLSGYVGQLFPRWPGYSQKRVYADLCDDAICWAYVCPACASSRYWPYYLD